MAVSTRLLVLSSVRQSRRQWVNVRCASPLLVWHRVKKLQSEVWFQQNWIISYLSLLLYTQLSSKLAGRETSSSVIHLGLPEQRTEEAAWSTQFHMARQTKQLSLIKKRKEKKTCKKVLGATERSSVWHTYATTRSSTSADLGSTCTSSLLRQSLISSTQFIHLCCLHRKLNHKRDQKKFWQSSYISHTCHTGNVGR